MEISLKIIITFFFHFFFFLALSRKINNTNSRGEPKDRRINRPLSRMIGKEKSGNERKHNKPMRENKGKIK